MITFEVNDMTCGHCVSTITKALKWTDKDAKVQIDLDSHLVHVETAAVGADELAETIQDAGYAPVILNIAVPTSRKEGASKNGSCCCA